MMDINTQLHVLWGVYNNPMTPDDKKAQCKELMEKALTLAEPNKLTKKIEEALNG